jgi:DNA polymerase-1
VATSRTDFLINAALEDVGATSLRIYLSDSLDNNYRYHIDNSYKAHRIDQPKPVHYDLLKEHLILKWGAKIAHNQEADDALGIDQTNEGDDSIICSIDKDLLQIPGNHYHLVKKERLFIEPIQGTRWFYQQLLIGDPVENVKGVFGVGPIKAAKLLGEVDNEEEMFTLTRKLYDDDDRLLINGRLLKIRTREDEIWNFPASPLKESQ